MAFLFSFLFFSFSFHFISFHLTVLSNVKVVCKRMLCFCEHPEWTLKQELKIARYRNFAVHGNIEFKNKFYSEQVETGLKRYDIEVVETESFKGVWYGPKASIGYDSKIILYVHGMLYQKKKKQKKQKQNKKKKKKQA
jgi:hypothetical protein